MNLDVTIEDLKGKSIFVGTPMYGGQCAGMFCKSTNDLAAMGGRYGIDVRFYYLFNESLVQRARNYVVDEFLRSDCSHLMFIDSDIGFNPKDVLTLLAIHTKYPDQYDVLTGPYPKKSISWEKVKSAVEKGKAENPFNLDFYTADYVFNPVKNMTSFKLNEPVEVSEAGTGFMLIPREVFEKYEKAYPEYKYRPDHMRTANFDGSREIMAYFDCGIDPDTKRYLSEDYFFCWNARKAGMKIHMCPWMELQHIGNYIFKGSMAAIASIEASPTATAGSNSKNYPKKDLTKKKKRNIIGGRP